LPDRFFDWFQALEQRHLKNLSFAEVRRGVQALSSLYVNRRDRIDRNAALDGSGKRAAFAMYFGPLHFLLVREIVRALGARVPPGLKLVDLGCGTGVAGAAWALDLEPRPELIGIDRNPWVLDECKWTYRQLGVQGAAKPANIGSVRLPSRSAVVAAFTINELDSSVREHFLNKFLLNASNGAPVLVIEPIARRLTSWWDDWARDWKQAGGREDEWRFRVDLPERLALMDKAAGLDHRELTGRSLWLPGRVIE
jgi:hypothetical protein